MKNTHKGTGKPTVKPASEGIFDNHFDLLLEWLNLRNLSPQIAYALPKLIERKIEVLKNKKLKAEKSIFLGLVSEWLVWDNEEDDSEKAKAEIAICNHVVTVSNRLKRNNQMEFFCFVYATCELLHIFNLKEIIGNAVSNS